MKNYIGIGVSIGVLAGIWTQLSGMLGLMTWVAFIAWALYFATGTKLAGAKTTLASTLSGVFWAWLTVLALGFVAFPGALAVLVGVLALVLCLQAAVPLVAYIPGSFIGAAVYFGTLGADPAPAAWLTGITLVIGVAFAFTSDVLGAQIQSVVDGRKQQPAPVPQQSVSPEKV